MNNYLEPISLTSKEFDEIISLVEKTCPNQCVISIERVVNPALYDRYFNYQISLGESSKEITLFHGTKYESILAICTNGFQKSKNTRAVFGLGTYLATAFGYSKQYSSGYTNGKTYDLKEKYNCLLVCKLAYNKATRGTSNSPCPDGFDVQVDNTSNPTIFSVHNDVAIYPQYVVRFYQ